MKPKSGLISSKKSLVIPWKTTSLKEMNHFLKNRYFKLVSSYSIHSRLFMKQATHTMISSLTMFLLEMLRRFQDLKTQDTRLDSSILDL
jgi:hypothetical protein